MVLILQAKKGGPVHPKGPASPGVTHHLPGKAAKRYLHIESLRDKAVPDGCESAVPNPP